MPALAVEVVEAAAPLDHQVGAEELGELRAVARAPGGDDREMQASGLRADGVGVERGVVIGRLGRGERDLADAGRAPALVAPGADRGDADQDDHGDEDQDEDADASASGAGAASPTGEAAATASAASPEAGAAAAGRGERAGCGEEEGEKCCEERAHRTASPLHARTN